MFRVWDIEKEEWVEDDVYLNQNRSLFCYKKSLIGLNKMFELDPDRYVYHRDIELYDKNNSLIYEGDYVRAQVDKNRFVVGIVVYAHELSAYIILCKETDEYYTLGNGVCEFIEKIGNVFEGVKEVKQDGESTLQESEK